MVQVLILIGLSGAFDLVTLNSCDGGASTSFGSGQSRRTIWVEIFPGRCDKGLALTLDLWRQYATVIDKNTPAASKRSRQEVSQLTHS